MDGGAWRATVRGVAELDVTEHAEPLECSVAELGSVCSGTLH